jgi:L-ascorbate metabolism protein UlaG (beta-lactamase superfamily)
VVKRLSIVRLYIISGVIALTAGPVGADVGVEYIGHASFVLESPAGVRVVIDPFNSNRWLGYRYPESIEADAVLVTHPHYDHDASYYWSDSVPVFREPGEYRVGDVRLVGVEGKHADPYGKDFEQKNTIWLIEAGGVRIVHLGDNGPLTARKTDELGRVDVVMLPADGDDHILKPEEIAAARLALGQPLVVPMHYRLDGFLDLPRSLGPLGPWLENQNGVVRLDSNRTRLARQREPGREVLVFQPSPELAVWPEKLRHAWAKLDEARAILATDPSQMARAGLLVQEAAEAYDSIVFHYQWARVLAQSGDAGTAIAVLESALARAARDDWQNRMSARSLLAELYAAAGRTAEAHEQHRIVLQQSYRTELLNKAKAFLASP